MRIVGGTLRGRPLTGPKHEGLRPTSDRVRESVFNILAHGDLDAALEGAVVLDLFAGSGALGIEALSRGAAYCLFVEEDAEARALIRRNIETFGLAGVTKIWRRDATDLGPAGKFAPARIAFLDPPYGKGLGERALTALGLGGWLAPGAIVMLEERADVDVVVPQGFAPADQRRWGDTQVLFLRWHGTAS
jgi:16S rRNA (guanine966-N2)-methyltransferase